MISRNKASLICILIVINFLKVYGRGSSSSPSPSLTNILQLVRWINSEESLGDDYPNVHLEGTVCAASSPDIGAVILRDSTGVELFEFTGGIPELLAGDKIRIDAENCWLRRREMGVELSLRPVVNNDGIHGRSTTGRGITLIAGRHLFIIEWFQRSDYHIYQPSLEVIWQPPRGQREDIPFTNVFCSLVDEKSGQTMERLGLVAEYFTGVWETIPNFALLRPVTSTVTTNFDVTDDSRHELTGIRFRGFLEVPVNGLYTFFTRSADGSLLFIDSPRVRIANIGKDDVPDPVFATINEPLSSPTLQRWVKVQGKVCSAAVVGRGADLKLCMEHNVLRVRIADASGLHVSSLENATIQVTGVGCPLIDLRGHYMLGELFVANTHGVELVIPAKVCQHNESWLVKAKQVQSLTLEEARRGLPVRLRGVVTSVGGRWDYWLSVQDDTRGIFVDFRNASNSVPMSGDFYEITGHSGAGDFAPIVIADSLERKGNGELPEPERPAWDEINNGSMDVQWVEIKGLVTGIQSNVLSMLLPAGEMAVQVEGPELSNLKPLQNAVVHIRGVLFAMWNATRELRVGRVLIRNANITVETPAPADPFDALLRTPRELLLFDPQATPFRRVKVQGQIVYADSSQAYLQQDGQGICLARPEKMDLRPGDLVEVVGYPNIRRSSLLLRQTIVRKLGWGNLPPARKLSESLGSANLDSIRVSTKGQLLGSYFEKGKPVLQMQSGKHLFLARLGERQQLSLRIGSQLALEGVYANRGENQQADAGSSAFELLLNSAADIQVFSQPSWWTLQRLLTLVGILFVILIIAAIWIKQLKRLVWRRTAELQREIHEREEVEKQRALEVERSRIARDLHDDLGTSLTEIAVLASKCQRGNLIGKHLSTLLGAITGKARELVLALDIIVWAADPKDDSLQSVADYLCDFANEFLSPSGIVCRYDVPVALPSIVVEGRLRHNLFLVVKETLNNIVRHSEATGVEFGLKFSDGRLEIVIKDNGVGFDLSVPEIGKGQKNLSARLSENGGRYEVSSIAGKGTSVKIELHLVEQQGGKA